MTFKYRTSIWNEWVSNTTRLSPRFEYTNGPRSKTGMNSVNNVANYSEFQQMQNENSVIEKCEITKSFTFITMFNLDFSSLMNESNHRDIVLATSNSFNNMDIDEDNIKVHRCVLSLWSRS